MASMPPISSTGTTPMKTYARISRFRSSHSVSLASRNTTRTISRNISTVKTNRRPLYQASGAPPQAIGKAVASVTATRPKMSLNSQEWRRSTSIRRVRARAWAAEAWGGPVWVSTVGMVLPLAYKNRPSPVIPDLYRGRVGSLAQWRLAPRRHCPGGFLQRQLHPAVMAAVGVVHHQSDGQPDQEHIPGQIVEEGHQRR